MSEMEQAGVTAGSLLRTAREAAGLHIGALAVALKVPVSKLEALEADNHAVLPDTVFVRALASSVCRTLKVDPAPILALLPQSQSPRLSADSAGLNAPVKSSVGKSLSSATAYGAGGGSASKSVVLVVLVLLLAATAVFFFPRQQADDSAAVPAATPVVSATPSAVSAPAEPAAHAATAVPTEPAVAPVPSPVAVPASAPEAAASEPAGSAAAAPSGTLVLRARSQSWVQVRDAGGKIVLERNLAAAESASVNVPPPLSVVIGRADATEVFVRGKPFDLAGVSRENVARFEVK